MWLIFSCWELQTCEEAAEPETTGHFLIGHPCLWGQNQVIQAKISSVSCLNPTRPQAQRCHHMKL